MSRKKQAQGDTEFRVQFYQSIENGQLSLAETVKQMRKITGLTQIEFAKLIKIAPRIIIDLERGVGNPTLQTLEKIGKPFGLRVVFNRRSGE